MVKLVKVDKYGAYVGVGKDFLKEFLLIEKNANFEVYDSKDHQNRFIAAKSSRLPDDDDNTNGRLGINFHRAKPSREDAKMYHDAISQKIISKQTLGKFAFAATTPEEYEAKSAIWDKFYTYVWDDKPQTLWVTPHSGNVNRKPDINFPYPKLELDSHVVSATARCAYRGSGETTKRIMMSIHSHNWFSAVTDMGGFGINDIEKLKSIAAKMEHKYTEKVQPLAEACRRDFSHRVLNWLEHIVKVRGTLHPAKLPPDGIEQDVIKNTVTGLKLYQKEIKLFTLEEFKEVINSLKNTKIQVVSCNHLFSGQIIGRQMEIAAKIQQGLLHGALQIEFMKFYLKHAPDLVADIILDVKHELFGE